MMPALVNDTTIINQPVQLLIIHPADYGCSLVHTVFIWKKSFILKNIFTEKNFLYREKYK